MISPVTVQGKHCDYPVTSQHEQLVAIEAWWHEVKVLSIWNQSGGGTHRPLDL